MSGAGLGMPPDPEEAVEPADPSSLEPAGDSPEATDTSDAASATSDLRSRAWALLEHPWAVPALLTALAALTFVWEIGDRSLWLDEATSVTFARRFVTDFPVFSDYNMTLYYGLLYVWTNLGVGESEAAVRLLSAIFATASVPILYGLTRRLFGPGTAALAALLLIVNAFVVYYAQETRGYALLMLLTVSGAWLVLRAIERPTWPRWAAFAIVAVLAMYTHFFAGPVLVAFAVFAVLVRGPRGLAGWASVAATGILVSTLPLGVAIIARGACQIDYLPELSVATLAVALQEVTGDQGLGRPEDQAFLFGSALLATYAVLVGIGVFAGIRAIRTRAAERDGYLLAILALFVPIGLVIVTSALVTPVLAPRYLIILAPWLALIAALGIEAVRPRWMGTILGVGLIVLSVAGTLHLYSLPGREEWRTVASVILDDAQPGDGVIFYTSSGEKPFAYYTRRDDAVARAPVQIELPSDNACRIDERYESRLLAGLARVDPLYHQRIWVVLTHQAEGAEQERLILEQLEGSYEVVERQRIGEKIEVVLFAATPPSSTAAPGSGGTPRSGLTG